MFFRCENSGVEYGETADRDVVYSDTNVQVAGVDEPDTIKTDGTYLYLITQGKIHIVLAYPSNNATILSTILFDSYSPGNIFIKDNHLIVLGQKTYCYPSNETVVYPSISYQSHQTVIKIYDVSDHSNPKELTTIEMDGTYFDARLIGEKVYIVTFDYLYDLYSQSDENQTNILPKIVIDNKTRYLEPADIYYVDMSESMDTTTHVAVINVKDLDITQKSFIIGCSQTLYVSYDYIYLASNHYQFYPKNLIAPSLNNDSTIIHKISIKNDDIAYIAQGEVPGRILNQFSMDEYNGNFRIATTIGQVWDTKSQSTNNIYILDEALKQIGSITDIAPGEKIYSARFIGEKAYLVTFKKVDPFFVIDLSDPTNPEILGALKIPGYSDYLHPYDEDHIIGIGKDTVEALESEKSRRSLDFAWYQGVKLALFDVTDVTDPQELAKIVIGDRGTTSPVLYDHKAFLFDRSKQLLVIPISLYEIDEEIKNESDGYTGDLRGCFTFQGAYVYRLSLEHGFEYQGRITHLTEEDIEKAGFYPSNDASIKRTLYIEENLYTISNSMIKIHDLNSLTEIASIPLL